MLFSLVWSCEEAYNYHNQGKIIWENNFITHCVQIKDEFKWAQEIIDLISQNLRPKGSYFKEVNDLKLDVRVVGE